MVKATRITSFGGYVCHQRVHGGAVQYCVSRRPEYPAPTVATVRAHHDHVCIQLGGECVNFVGRPPEPHVLILWLDTGRLAEFAEALGGIFHGGFFKLVGHASRDCGVHAVLHVLWFHYVHYAHLRLVVRRSARALQGGLAGCLGEVDGNEHSLVHVVTMQYSNSGEEYGNPEALARQPRMAGEPRFADASRSSTSGGVRMSIAYEAIVVAVDASEEAEVVLQAATELAHKHLDILKVITVIPPVFGGVGGVDGMSFAATWPVQDMEQQLTREITDSVRERVARFGIAPDQAVVAFGRPAAEIRAYAERVGADLIVIGSHGRSGVRGVLGSTANGVVHGTPCDLLVVRVH